jgi:hypothetical protein
MYSVKLTTKVLSGCVLKFIDIVEGIFVLHDV